MNIGTLFLVILLLAVTACAPEPAATPSPAAAPAAAPSAGVGPAAAAPAADIDARLAVADPAMGQRQYIYCQACHSVDAGGAHKVGPNLHGVFAQPAGQAEGYVYSTVLRESGITWDAAAMDKWLANPAAMVPGTTMVFAGVADPAQRANLIAYLQQVTGASN
jgi:cytochrome c